MATPRQRKKANPVGNVDDYNKTILLATIKNLELSLKGILTEKEKLTIINHIIECKERLNNAK